MCRVPGVEVCCCHSISAYVQGCKFLSFNYCLVYHMVQAGICGHQFCQCEIVCFVVSVVCGQDSVVSFQGFSCPFLQVCVCAGLFWPFGSDKAFVAVGSGSVVLCTPAASVAGVQPM